MWIDFNLYFYVRIHKSKAATHHSAGVVNWFQFVFLREDSQERTSFTVCKSSCELISICIFTWGFTSQTDSVDRFTWLWIDFNLYFYVRIHKSYFKQSLRLFVVNWFQFVFLREDSQGIILMRSPVACCELISICIFTWGFTSVPVSNLFAVALWIDFNLYFYVRIHKGMAKQHLPTIVVNWFQFVFLREDSQVYIFQTNSLHRCELISICIFTWGFTRHKQH